MPIRPENKARYPTDWNRIRGHILRRAHHHCERCGVENHRLGGRDSKGEFWEAICKGEKLLRLEWPRPGDIWWCAKGGKLEKLRIIRIVLTIAHLDHTPENCAEENLQALCQRCHLALDAEHHAMTRYQTRREGKAVLDLFEAPRA